MTLTPSLLAMLRGLDGRCADCGFHAETQGHRAGCPQRDEPQRLADQGMARAEAAHPGDVEIVDRAIAAACRSGQPFSANDFRHLCEQLEQPNVIGARIRAWVASKRLKNVGYVKSSLPGTHAHKIGVYSPP